MPIVSDLVEPLDLTAFVRELPIPANYTLNQYLPDRPVPDVEYAIDTLQRENVAAVYRSRDAETPFGRRNEILTRTRGEIPPVSIKYQLTEEDRLRLARLQGRTNDPLIRNEYSDAERGQRAVMARVEMARGQVMSTGSVTIAENGVQATVSFATPSSHAFTTTTAWSDVVNSDPVADLLAWSQTYLDDTGELPGGLVGSRVMVTYLLRNQKLRQLLLPYGGGTGAAMTRQNVYDYLASEGLPPIVEYDAKVSTQVPNGTVTRARVTPLNKLMFLPSDLSAYGETKWGITAEALSLAGGSNPRITAEDAPGLVSVVMEEGDPVKTWTKVASTPMPVLFEPWRWAAATCF